MNKRLIPFIILMGLITGLSFSHIGKLEQTKHEKIKYLKLEVTYHGKYLITITEMNEARMTNGKDNTNIYLTRESDEPWFLAVHVEKIDKSISPLYVYISYLNGTMVKSGIIDDPEGAVNINLTLK